MRPPILFHCQHLLGLGHAKRAALLARALAKAGEHVLFVQGGLAVPGLDPGGAEVLALPPLVAADDALYEAKEGGRDQYRVSVLGAEAPGA